MTQVEEAASLVDHLIDREGELAMLRYWATSNELPPFEGIDARPVTYRELHDRYATSDWGRYHATQPLRFSQNFGYDHAQMARDLGDDVDPIRHMLVVHHLSKFFILEALEDYKYGQPPPLTVEDICAVRLEGIVHEIGEGEAPELKELLSGNTVGDVPYDQKTKEQNMNEEQVRVTNFERFYRDLPSWLQRRVLDLMAHREQSRASRISTTTHTTSFIQTIGNAGSIVNAFPLTELPTKRIIQLSRLARDCSRNLSLPKKGKQSEDADLWVACEESKLFREELVHQLRRVPIDRILEITDRQAA